MANEQILRRWQAGREAVRGTAATVQRKVYGDYTFTYDQAVLDIPKYRGSYDAWTDFIQGVVTIAGSGTEPLTYQDFVWWAFHFVEGTPVVTAGVTTAGVTTDAAAIKHVFTPTSGVDDLSSSTWEHGVPSNVYRSTRVMTPEVGLAIDIDGEATWMLTPTLIGRTYTPLAAGFTAAIPDRAVDYIASPGSQVWIDDPGSAIGTTLQTDKVVSFGLTWDNAVNPKRFLENRREMSTRIGRGARMITGQLTMEFDDDAEFSDFRAGLQRRIRVRQTSETMIPTTTVPFSSQIDLPDARFTSMSKAERNGNIIATWNWRANTDLAAGYPAQLTVVNDQPAANYPTS